MNRDDLKDYFRILHTSTSAEQNKRAIISEGGHVPPESDSEDVEQLASHHALNGDVDATLYRDNPDYRRAFIEMIIATHGEGHEKAPSGRPHLDYGSLEAEDDALDALRNPSYYDEDTVDDDLDDDGKVPYSKEYAKMIDTFSPYPK